MTAPDSPDASRPDAASASASSTPPQEIDWDSNPLAVIGRSVAPPVMYDPKRREEMGLPKEDDTIGRYMIELNILYRGGLAAAAVAFVKLFADVLGAENGQQPVPISKSYLQCWMTVPQWRRLLQVDDAAGRKDSSARVIYKLWPDFKVKALIDHSVATVKADAAVRAYDATGAGITWAVIDSGIEGGHPHFGFDTETQRSTSTIYNRSVVELHRDFTRPPLAKETAPAGKDQTQYDNERQRADDLESATSALTDPLGHGTHVAGIIAGHLPERAEQVAMEGASPEPAPLAATTAPRTQYAVFEQVFKADLEGSVISSDKTTTRRDVPRSSALRGVAPDCSLVSLKVLDENGEGRVSDIMRALVYIRDHLNDDPKILRVHGVNLSVGYDFDAQMFACGQSPLCVEVDRLVKSGVVVVVAAGNTGYGKVGAEQRWTKIGLSNTINDPGNAALAITVGSTHRDSPHTYGVSYFSSKGPTGDGRLKPDLVAPGERITSCAATAKCVQLGMDVHPGVATYVDDSGTSMAAPHVSGAVAAFLSIRREFIQRPEEVKRMFLEGATSLGRERYFEGHGLVDLMRTIQSV
jgi:serine protease AprX